MEISFSDLINQYWYYSDGAIEIISQIKGYEVKEQVGKINDLKIEIFTNDHIPPHFHIISKDKSVNAKFTIENCEHISGDLTSKQMKKVKAFYNSPKTSIIMGKIWNKRNG